MLWLALRFTAVIIVLFVLMGALVYSIVAAGIQASTNTSLASATLIDSPSDAPLGVFVAISTGEHMVFSREVPRGLPDTAAIARVAANLQDEQGNVVVEGRSYTVLTAYRNGRVIQAAVAQHESQEELNRLLLAMMIAAVVAAALAAGLSVWMARRAMKPMAAALALQRRFVADASHELRTPLTLLSTRAQLLRRKLDGSGPKLSQNEVADGVAKLVADSQMLTGILDDLLLSADPRETVDHVPVSLLKIADRATALAESEAQQRAIRLTRSGSNETVTVRGSEVALGRVFTALIANALDHAKTSVEIQVEVHGRDAIIRVIDDGTGFASGSQARAFDRFASSRPFTDQPATPRHYGLGLALVAEIVAQHGGKVLVEQGAETKGATVKVLLPLEHV